MDKILYLLPFWWILVLGIIIVFYRYFLKYLGIAIVPENKIGVVTKKFVLFGANPTLPEGRIIALNGEAGYQADTLPPGLYFWYWPWQYNIQLVPLTNIPPGMMGLIIAKDGDAIPNGKILGKRVECKNFQDAREFLQNGGQKGRQTAFITAGSYRINTAMFEVVMHEVTHVQQNTVGIVTTFDGEPLNSGEIAGEEVKGHGNFQNADAFLENGGNRGLQNQVLLAGTWNINPWFAEVKTINMTEVPIGYVGVVISYIGPEGQDVTGEAFKHGNIVKKGQKGVWNTTLNPGKYPINTFTTKVVCVPTTNIVLNWAEGKTEAHKLDAHLSTITVRSSDGFRFNLDVSQIIHVPAMEAPKVIARFGSVESLVSQVLEPTIGNYFRNSSQKSDVIAFLGERSQRQEDAKLHIEAVLKEYNIQAVDTLIGDINPPPELMQTLTERKIAHEQKATFEIKRSAEEQRTEYEQAKAVANMQERVVETHQNVEIAKNQAKAAIEKAKGEAEAMKVTADQNVEITKNQAKAAIEKAKGEAEAMKITADAKAQQITIEGKATANAYADQIKVINEENLTLLKAVETIANSGVKITPDILVSGSNEAGGLVQALLAKLLKKSEQESNND